MNKGIDIQRMMSMAPRVRLGDYIERCTANNSDLKYGSELIEGVNSDGSFCPPKANTEGINMKPYRIVKDGYFVYNPSRLNIGSFAYRNNQGMCLVSHLYVVFKLNGEGSSKIEPLYLYLYCTRKEFFREVTYRNYGSQRPEFNFYDMSDMIIPLPSIEVQRKIVAVYEGLRQTAEQNEAMVEPLTKACHAYIVDCKEKYPSVRLGDYIEDYNERNSDGILKEKDVRGISTEKVFTPTKAKLSGVSLNGYKLVQPRTFAYVADTSRRGDKVALGYNMLGKPILISSIYTTFRCKDDRVLNSEYLYLFLDREEFDRYSRFNSWGSARETFDWSEMERVQIPLPPIEVQQAIVNLYHCSEEAKAIATESRNLMKTICPALVQKAAHSL